MAKLFEKQRTNFYYNWLSFIEDFEKFFGVFFNGAQCIYNLIGLPRTCMHKTVNSMYKFGSLISER